ncbi:2-dehydropantoate 2-reductase [Sphingomonas swuensis]|uniref:2-dehydropantoate 2-reductase n=1 Tax=Sphingomonas swuensis TaxID=977800 RepID=A0ABP7TD13_9SPHN
MIAGAGSIGCFVGGLLAVGGERVTLLARPRIAAEVAAHGLTLGSFEGWSETVDADALAIETDPARALARASLILVTVKSGQTEEMGRLIAAHAPSVAPVISLQNGLDNAARLRALLPGRPVFAGMVSFNVLHRGEGRFHRGTSGPLVIEAGAPPLEAPHLDIVQHPDITAVLAGKLVYNLNNALNALSGLTLREQLGDRAWRRLLADCQDEALRLFEAMQVEPWSLGGLPVRRFPFVLRLPNLLFRIAARRGVRIDATARSSMMEDLERGRPTEIDELQGKVVALGGDHGIATPANRAVFEAIRKAEKKGPGSPRLTPQKLLEDVSS